MNSSVQEKKEDSSLRRTALAHKPCNTCVTSDSQVEYAQIRSAERDPYDVLRCKVCDLRWVNGDPKLEWYSESSHSIEEQPRIIREQKMRNAKHRVEQLAKYLPIGARILDVGCGTGEFVYLSSMAGFQAEGAEPSRDEAEFAREHYHAQVLTGAVSEGQFRDSSVDAITLWGVIEHLGDPKQVLSGLARMLRPGGLLVIQTPTEDALFRKTARMVWRISGARAHVLINQFYLWALHYFGYNEKSLRALLNSIRFETIKVESGSFGIRILFERFSKWPWYKRWPACLLTALIGGVERLAGGGNHVVVFARKIGPLSS